MTKIILSLIISISILLIRLRHPLSIGLILILQTVIIALVTSIMLNSPLFSYIILIIILSGALVLFTYIARVASNEKFQTSFKITFFIVVVLLVSYILIDNIDIIENISVIYEPETISLIKIFNTLSAYITTIMILYLLLTIIVVPNITRTTEGPLRIKI